MQKPQAETGEPRAAVFDPVIAANELMEYSDAELRGLLRQLQTGTRQEWLRRQDALGERLRHLWAAYLEWHDATREQRDKDKTKREARSKRYRKTGK